MVSRPLSGLLLVLLWTRLQHVSRRLAALAARAAAGRALTRRHVAPPTPARRAPPAPWVPPTPWAPPAPSPRLPYKFAWLVRLVPEAACYGSQLRHLLAEPEMAALLAASPQARRLLRPLCRMLAVAPPQAVPREAAAVRSARSVRLRRGGPAASPKARRTAGSRLADRSGAAGRSGPAWARTAPDRAGIVTISI